MSRWLALRCPTGSAVGIAFLVCLQVHDSSHVHLPTSLPHSRTRNPGQSSWWMHSDSRTSAAHPPDTSTEAYILVYTACLPACL